MTAALTSPIVVATSVCLLQPHAVLCKYAQALLLNYSSIKKENMLKIKRKGQECKFSTPDHPGPK